MLTKNNDIARAALSNLTLAGDEASQFEVLRDTLPKGWVVDLQGDAGMAWAAFVYQADAPRSWPMFTICRWDDRVGLFTQWMNGSASSATAFSELWPILEPILSGIFASAQAHLTTVSVQQRASARH